MDAALDHVPRFPMRTYGLRFDAIALIGKIPVPGTLVRCGDRIRHVQIADPPGRGVPGTGNAGSVGLGYYPLDLADSSTSFGWL